HRRRRFGDDGRMTGHSTRSATGGNMSRKLHAPGIRMLGALALGILAIGATVAACGGKKTTELTFARFFGSCEAEYGKVTDVKQARGECGIITSIVNQFNATN